MDLGLVVLGRHDLASVFRVLHLEYGFGGQQKEMICLNFWGGAGIGKSTLAAKTYATLKELGYRTEQTGEYAKELVYENSMRVIRDQLYLFAEQEHRLRCLEESGVEIAVCDSPTPLSILYDRDKDHLLADLIWSRYQKHSNINFVIRRDPEMFTELDRVDTIQSALAMDKKVLQFLESHGESYQLVEPGDVDTVMKHFRLNYEKCKQRKEDAA